MLIVSLLAAILCHYVYDTKEEKTLTVQHENISLVPSSSIKIALTGAALSLLDPEMTFSTYLEYDGVIKDGSLFGNIYIRGTGDPTLGSQRIPPSLSWKEQIQIWAKAIENAGIKEVTGKIVPDASLWETALAVPSWTWEDLGNYFGAGASALSFNENSYTLVFTPGKSVGDPVTILRTDPPMSHMQFVNEVLTGPPGSGDQAWIFGMEYVPAQFIRGTIPLGVEEFSIRGSIPNPPDTAARLLKQECQSINISILEKDIPPSSRIQIHETISPKLKTIIHWTNRRSINLYAEHLLKTLGKGSTKNGVQVVTDFWERQGMPMKGFHLADGSGLSRKNHITCEQLVWMLRYMKNTPHFSLFFESLPMKHQNVRAKSGYMSGVKSYAGYVGDKAFACIVNDEIDVGVRKQVTDFLSSLTQAPKKQKAQSKS